ncbi:MAG: response regulator [Sporolactobacillus sp.]
MKAIIVDDEELACNQLRKLLQDTGVFREISTYLDPVQALKEAGSSPVDAAFLDIEMPEVSGIDLAEALQNLNEKIQIVFATAFNEFAIQAFELNAVDYLLKPIMKSRLEKTVARLLKYWETAQIEEDTGERLGIECLDNLQFYRMVGNQKVYIPVKWRTSKAREVYAYLLNQHDRCISKDIIIERFWSGIDPVKANTQLYTTIYQIRKMMERLPFHHHIVKNDVGYTLNIADTKIDSEVWEQELKRLPKLTSATFNRHLHLFQTYKNHYLVEYGYLWAESERIRLAQLWLNHAYFLIDFLIKQKRYEEAIDICHGINRIEPEDERTMKYLLKLYNKTGNVDGAIRIYGRYKENGI